MKILNLIILKGILINYYSNLIFINIKKQKFIHLLFQNI